MAKTATKKRKTVVNHELTPSKAKGHYITPYVYGKNKGIRPQMVYQWVLKQGAPAKEIAGKIYINSDEIDEWQSTKGERRVERQKVAAEKAAAKQGPPVWLINLLLKGVPNKAEAYCKNCHMVTRWRFDIEWTDLDLNGPFKTTRCVECQLNMREYPVTQERAIQALKGEITLRVPAHSTTRRLEPEEWLGLEAETQDAEEPDEFVEDETEGNYPPDEEPDDYGERFIPAEEEEKE